jgi:hypothetical protein
MLTNSILIAGFTVILNEELMALRAHILIIIYNWGGPRCGAMVVGRSTDVGYVPTFVKDGVSGFIVKNILPESKIIEK